MLLFFLNLAFLIISSSILVNSKNEKQVSMENINDIAKMSNEDLTKFPKIIRLIQGHHDLSNKSVFQDESSFWHKNTFAQNDVEKEFLDQEKKLVDETNSSESTEELEKVDVSFDNISLSSLIKLIADKKQMNYIASKDLANIKVSVKLFNPLDINKSWNTLLTLLDLNGFSHVQVGDLHKFFATKESASEPYPFYSSAKGVTPDMLPEADQIIRYVYFLKNIKSDLANSILSTLLTEKPQTVNDIEVLIIKDKSRNIRQAMKIIEELDSVALRQSISILPLKHIEADAAAKFLNEEIIGKGSSDRIRIFTPFKKNMKYFSADIRVIPYKAKQMLIFLGQQPEINRLIQFVRLAVDIEIGNAVSRIHIKDIKYQSPDQIKKMLENLIKPTTPGGANSTPDFFKDIQIVAESSGSSRDGGGAGSRIIVACSPDDWKRLSHFIDMVDKPQPQIALEIMVIDASLDLTREIESRIRDSRTGILNQGLAFRINNDVEAIESSSQNGLDSREGSSLVIPGSALNTPGQTLVTVGGINKDTGKNDIWAYLTALVQQNNSAIISQPFAVVNNNESYTISTSEVIKVYGEISTANSRSVRKFSYEPVDSSVTITPRINASGLVDLKISVSTSDIIGSAAQDKVNTSKRLLKTRAIMGLGEVLVLGGTDKSKQGRTNYSSPLLSKIPVFGNLFKGTNKSSNKTRLYFMIRPSVIKPQINSNPDDYTNLKFKYAKYQVQNVNSYAKSTDPIERFFFKPRSVTIKQAANDYKNNRFTYIDDFAERKQMPNNADMNRDNYYHHAALEKQGTPLAHQSPIFAASKHEAKPKLKEKKSRKTIIKEIIVPDPDDS